MLSKHGLKLTLLISFFIPLVSAKGYSDETRKHITLAVLPCYDVLTTFKKFSQMAAYLKDHTGFDIDIVVPQDLERIRSSLQSGDIDFILQDPHTYVELADLLNRDSILSALARDGTSSQSGLIIVRKDSGIKEVKDLKGKSIMFGPKLSIAKWIAARQLLEKNGIKIDTDLKSYSHGGCCEDIAFYVYLKAVDAGAVCDDFFSEHKEDKSELGIDLKQIAVIGTTGAFPTRVFAANRGMDLKVVARVNQALLNLDRRKPEHEKILGPTGLGVFKVSRDQDYESIRTLMSECPP